jgi:hypothetical protein
MRQYDHYRIVLQDALGIEPSHELTAIIYAATGR